METKLFFLLSPPHQANFSHSPILLLSIILYESPADQKHLVIPTYHKFVEHFQEKRTKKKKMVLSSVN